MNRTQKYIITGMTPLSLLILQLDPVGPAFYRIQYLRYATMLSLAIAVLLIPAKKPEQRLMSFAFAGMALGDFFLVFAHTLSIGTIDVAPMGILSFLTGYIFLIAAYRKTDNPMQHTALEKRFIYFVRGIFITTSAAVALLLFRRLEGIQALLGIVFLIELTTMSSYAAITPAYHYYSRKSAFMLALSGIFMYVCDIGIAFSLYHPYFINFYIRSLKNVVWFSYLSGWTLLALVIAERRLYAKRA